MTPTLGVNAKAYRLSTGSRVSWGTVVADGVYEGAAPASLSEVANCQDIEVPSEDGKADVTTRAGGGHKLSIGGLTESDVTLKMIYDPADTDVVALTKAKLTRTKIALAFLSGDKATVGVVGFWADFAVTGMKKGEPMGEAQTMEFTLSPTLSAVAPQWVRITAGA